MTSPASRASPQRPSRIVWIALVGITLLSFGLRFAAIDRLLPVRTDPDDALVKTYQTLSGFEVDNAELNYAAYPVLLPRILTLVTSPDALRPAATDAALAEHLRAASAPYRHVRVLCALLSFLLAPLCYFVARRWVGESWALLAAAFLATALLHLAHSTMAKAHGAHATLAWLTILCALRQVEAPSLRRLAATTGASALSIGTFHSGLFTLAPLALTALLWRAPSRRAAWAAWVAPLVALATGLLFTPGGIHLGAGGVKLGRGHSIRFENLDGSGLGTWLQLLWEHDPVLGVLAGAGALVAVAGLGAALRDRERRSHLLLLASYVGPYGLLISLDHNVQDRYLLPVYPVFALLATLAVRAALGRLRRPALVAATCLLLLAAPTWIALRYTLLGLRPDTTRQAAAWLEEQPQATQLRLLLTPGLALPLFTTPAMLAEVVSTPPGRAQAWTRYQGELATSPGGAPAYDLGTLDPRLFGRDAASRAELERYLEASAPDLILLEVSDRVRVTPGFEDLRQLLRARGAPVAVFSGEDERWAGAMPIDYQYARDMAGRVLAATAFGPRIEVYRWPRP